MKRYIELLVKYYKLDDNLFVRCRSVTHGKYTGKKRKGWGLYNNGRACPTCKYRFRCFTVK